MITRSPLVQYLCRNTSLASLAWLSALLAALPLVAQGDTVGKWRRWTLEMPNPTYSGNPFELEVDATLTHAGSGTTISLPGYYAGSDTWKVSFMPTETGEWSYLTSSSDADLDGLAGLVTAVESGHPGLLAAAADHPRKWRFADGPYVVPIGLLLSVFLDDADETAFIAAADFLSDDVGGQLFNFRLTNLAFTGDWRDHELDLELWDRLDERLEILTDRGLGISLMPYTDDAGKPPWGAQSETEELLIRYMVARLASFPSVFFNTGIDISEYRDQAWVDWYGDRVRSLDPYGHPVSSRYGGGSGNLVMAGQLYDSRGARFAEIDELTEFFDEASVPVGVDDNWGEQYVNRGNFSPEDLRRAFWKCTVAGGVASHVRDDTTNELRPGANDPDAYFPIDDVAAKLESEQWLGLINPFLVEFLGPTFGEMTPAPELVSNGYALADPSLSKLLFFLMGVNDQFDSGDGGPISLELAASAERYTAFWFDPRSGETTDLGRIDGGGTVVLDPPDNDDWVLLLAAPQLTVAGSCPGTITLSATGLSSDAPVALFRADAEGTATLPQGPCAGTELDLADPQPLIFARATAGGTLTVERTVGQEACGRWLQAVAGDVCWVTNSEQLP